MRVITGLAKGRRLSAPPGMGTRPTTGLVKESVFSIIQFEIAGASVLDLFAGSGQMGIEALSRGARYCVFVENSRAALSVIENNLKTVGFSDKAKLLGTDAAAYVKSASGPFDVAFLDPPYGAGINKLLPELGGIMSASGIIICETEKSAALPETAGKLLIHREYIYGKTKITIYRNAEGME